MIAVLSPAKTLDFETEISLEKSKARLFDRSKVLLDTLKDKNEQDLQSMMSISDQLAALNVKRFQKFSTRHTPKNSKQSLFAFKGDVYVGLDADDFSADDTAFAQDHLRILSGLYGLLRPLDGIQPYRLEMGTQLHVNGYKNLYEFWGDTISKTLNKDLRKQGDKVLVNLASVEYFKSVDRKALKAKVIDVDFKDFKNGEYKIISFFAKKARGLMARYMIKNRISQVEDLKGFNYEGYYFDEQNSTDTFLAFKRG
ncbi:peroxide stress protein YaaA [Marinoscillum sp.]|uniref:peroxide stress protein YaaA n=1 Tax=Marinoscillum sp. TaxID=2024838 RepID=UPI003BA8620F